MKIHGIILATLLVAGCNTLETSLDATKAKATALVFTTGTSTIQTNRVVTDRADIMRILSGIDVGRETPYSKHPFRYQMAIGLNDGSTVRLSFEEDIHGQYRSIRGNQKQYLLSQRSYELLKNEMSIQQGTAPLPSAPAGPSEGAR